MNPIPTTTDYRIDDIVNHANKGQYLDLENGTLIYKQTKTTGTVFQRIRAVFGENKPEDLVHEDCLATSMKTVKKYLNNENVDKMNTWLLTEGNSARTLKATQRIIQICQKGYGAILLCDLEREGCLSPKEVNKIKEGTFGQEQPRDILTVEQLRARLQKKYPKH
jgi:hypothetical protein